MNASLVGRNDPCPCGSGKKFKKCCLQARSSYLAETPARFAQPTTQRSFTRSVGAVSTRSAPPPRMAGLFDDLPAQTAEDEPDAPPLQSVPLLPVEVGLHYTFPESFGLAEVTFVFRAGQVFLLEDETPILVDELKVGDRVILQDDQIATITQVKMYYEPPDPPTVGENGRVLSRVIGTIKHKGPAVVDVKWPGYTATSSPEHAYFSVSRQTYVPANSLQVGELLRTDDNLVAPVQQVSEPRYGLIDLYNIEVEHFHNYYVGSGQGNSVLVHNGAGAAGGYINTPRQAQATQGGVYVLRDPVTGQVMRSGRTANLARRQAEHARAAETAGLTFEPVYSTNVYAEQRGLEQIVHFRNNPPHNRIAPIDIDNPRLSEYLLAGVRFLRRQ